MKFSDKHMKLTVCWVQSAYWLRFRKVTSADWQSTIIPLTVCVCLVGRARSLYIDYRCYITHQLEVDFNEMNTILHIKHRTNESIDHWHWLMASTDGLWLFVHVVFCVHSISYQYIYIYPVWFPLFLKETYS